MQTLLIITQVAGIIVILGTLFLLLRRVVVLNEATGNVTEFAFPILGRVKTQSPVIMMLVIGAAMVMYAVSKSDPEMGVIEGAVDTGGRPVSMLIVATPHYQMSQQEKGEFRQSIPLLRNAEYRVKFIVEKEVVADRGVRPNGKPQHMQVDPVEWRPPVSDDPQFELKKEGSDEEIRGIMADR